MIVLDCPQRSEEWFAARLGIPTSSCFEKIITTNGKPSKSAEAYMETLAADRIRGYSEDTYESYDMKRGRLNEPLAAGKYGIIQEAVEERDVVLTEVGLCYRNEAKRYSCSPDRLVDEDGGLEIKDAKGQIQVNRLRYGWSKANHFQQIQGCIFITGRKWWDRVSHSTGLPIILDRYYRDDPFCAALKVALDDFCEELDALTEKLRGLA